jgi:hypothetical protein
MGEDALFSITVSDWSLFVHAVKPGAIPLLGKVKLTGTASPLPHSRAPPAFVGGGAVYEEPSDAEKDGALDPPPPDSDEPDEDEHAATTVAMTATPQVAIALNILFGRFALDTANPPNS